AHGRPRAGLRPRRHRLRRRQRQRLDALPRRGPRDDAADGRPRRLPVPLRRGRGRAAGGHPRRPHRPAGVLLRRRDGPPLRGRPRQQPRRRRARRRPVPPRRDGPRAGRARGRGPAHQRPRLHHQAQRLRAAIPMIETRDALQALVDRARTAEAVALDTEFVWERTYYPQLGVVQLGLGGDDVHLLDAAALDLAPLGALLTDAAVVKVLHDAVQDLTILRRATGASAVNVFDTQRAAGFVGLTSTLSLQDLFAEAVGVKLPKGATRSNWLKRPLSDEQTAYAED